MMLGKPQSWPQIGPLATALLLPGLLLAVLTDGDVPTIITRVLFAILALLDAIMIYWLTEPRAR
jgi:hypothetical protein